MAAASLRCRRRACQFLSGPEWEGERAQLEAHDRAAHAQRLRPGSEPGPGIVDHHFVGPFAQGQEMQRFERDLRQRPCAQGPVTAVDLEVPQVPPQVHADVAAVDAVLVVAGELALAVHEQPVERVGEVRAGRDRQRQRSPEARVDLDHHPGTGARVALELDHRHARMVHRAHQPAGRVEQLGIEGLAHAVRARPAQRRLVQAHVLEGQQDLALVGQDLDPDALTQTVLLGQDVALREQSREVGVEGLVE